MKTDVAAIAGAAGLACAFDGACAALTAVPPLVMACAGLLCSAFAFAASRRRRPRVHVSTLLQFALGAACGLLLPSSPPVTNPSIVSHSPGISLHGDLFDALAHLDDDPRNVIGRRISVSGVWTPAAPGRSASISRRVMTCCAADAIAVGFDVRSSRALQFAPGAWVRIEGVVRACIGDGEMRYVLELSPATRLEECALDSR